MSDFQSTYRVGPHCFRITNSSATDIREGLPSLRPFVIPTPDSEDILFTLQLVAPDAISPSINAPKPTDINFAWEDAQCVIRPLEDKNYLVAITPWGAERTYHMECADRFQRCTAYLLDEKGEDNLQMSTLSFVLNNFLMMLYAFNGAHHNTLLMHASVIAHNGKGYLFLGKSGTGKSTHTSLWLKNIKDCHLLNDDNPVVHVDSNSKQVTVYGSPWSGKTPCYRNEHMPVGAFVRLEQAPQNEISHENVVCSFAALLPSCSCLKQDKEIYKGIVATVTEVASLAPVFHLKCLPDKEAAELCRRTVNKG